MRRSPIAAGLAAALLLAGCGRDRAPTAQSVASAAPSVCRVGPEGGPVGDIVADKGIGGTGAPALADKGISGTGIVAVITGFASICLAGQEVALPAGAPIDLDGAPGRADALRAGQVAVVQADAAVAGLSARRVSIRFEVSGPVEAVEGDRLRVAGQAVRLTAATLGSRPTAGDWVAVSGIRQADGTVEATRMQPRAPGPAVLHGVLQHDGDGYRVGTLPLSGPADRLAALAGQSVRASGPILLGRMEVEALEPDLLASDPARFFGPAVGVVLIEGFGEIGGGRLRIGGAAFPAGDLGAAPARRGVFRLERAGAGLRAVAGLGGATASGREFTPAPLPAGRGGRVGDPAGRPQTAPMRGSRGPSGEVGGLPGGAGGGFGGFGSGGVGSGGPPGRGR